MLFDQSVDWTDRSIIVSLQSIHTPRKWGNSSVMTERWRLINGRQLYDIKQDPGQKTDIAAEHPDVVKTLRQKYETWWADVSRRFDEHAYIVIGSEHENPAMLTGYDWDMVPLAPWNQRHIRAGEVANGNWYIEVAREGDYEFRLQRWPKELGKAIQDTIATFWPENDMAAEIPRGVSLKPDRARLRIADFDETKPVNLNATSVVFNCHLKPGKTTMKTWFIENDKTIDRGAYYVYVERL
jgi:arylsulfatase B